jgi:hypothetical protein
VKCLSFDERGAHLFSGRVRDTIDHVVELIPHSLGCNTSSGRTEVLCVEGRSRIQRERASNKEGSGAVEKQKDIVSNERATTLRSGVCKGCSPW